jgi:hypothetical protein
VTTKVEENGAVEKEASPDHVFQITVNLPHKPYKLPIMVRYIIQLVENTYSQRFQRPNKFKISVKVLPNNLTLFNTRAFTLNMMESVSMTL